MLLGKMVCPLRLGVNLGLTINAAIIISTISVQKTVFAIIINIVVNLIRFKNSTGIVPVLCVHYLLPFVSCAICACNAAICAACVLIVPFCAAMVVAVVAALGTGLTFV